MERIHQLPESIYMSLDQFFLYSPFNNWKLEGPNIHIEIQNDLRRNIFINTHDTALNARLKKVMDIDLKDLGIYLDLDKKIFSMMKNYREFFRTTFSDYILSRPND